MVEGVAGGLYNHCGFAVHRHSKSRFFAQSKHIVFTFCTRKGQKYIKKKTIICSKREEKTAKEVSQRIEISRFCAN